MRLLVLFDIPQQTKKDQKEYRRFIKFFKENGYVRVQYSVYAKLCINSFAIKTQVKQVELSSPLKGSVRYLTISEKQYQSIRDITDNFSLQEKITNENRMLVIGSLDDI